MLEKIYKTPSNVLAQIWIICILMCHVIIAYSFQVHVQHVQYNKIFLKMYNTSEW